jgi:hypothetical protein
MITLDLSILNQKGTPMFNSDIFANRPTFGIPGRIFISTDTLAIYRDTGSSWTQLGGGGGTIGGFINTGQVAFGTATNTIGSEASFFWDSVNNKLGIGTNTPADAIEITANFGGGLYARIRNTNAGIGSVSGINLINDAIKTGGLYLFSSLFTPNGTRGPNTLTLFSGPDTNISVAVNSTGYFSIGTGNVETEKFRVFNNGNVLIQDGGTFTDGGQRLQVTGTSNFVGNISLSLNQNAATGLTISNNTSGTAANSFLKLQTTNASTYGEFAKLSSAFTTYKIFVGNDLAIYNTNTSGDIAILNDFATGRIKFAAGGSSTAQATLFSNGNFAINTTTDTGERLQVTGTSKITGASSFGGNMTLTLNQNAPTFATIVNTTSGSSSWVELSLTSNTTSGSIYVGKYSTLKTPYKIISSNDGFLLNNVSGDIAILNDVATGKIKFAAGGVSTEQATLFTNGNFVLGSTSDTGQRLQVTGLQYNLHSLTYSGSGVHTLSIFKSVTINQTITGGNGINNQRNFGSNIFASTQSVPATTTYANIFNYNDYQFSAAGVTLSADQATGGVRTISQLTTQNVFGGSFNGTMSHVSGIQINGYYNNATGTITPNITNAYQLLINDTGEFGHTFSFTNRWGIYQRGINDRNYLEGNLLLNSTTDTGQILQVNGAIRVNGQSSGTAGVLSGNYLSINVDGTSYKIALLNP